MLSVIAAHKRNSPAQVVQKCAGRLIDGTQCFHCDRLENVYYYYYYYYYYY